MVFEPTREQNAAIDAKGSVLVSAAAGSGKTAVLVERVIKMLTNRENPVLANRLLIVTFTNAAAAEMLSRIENRLYEELEKNPDDELINRQRYLIKSADICTIDSFCIKLVRDNFALCGIEPNFKVTDDTALYVLRREVLRNLIGEYIEKSDMSFKLLLRLSNCRFDEENLAELVDKIYIDSKKSPFPKNFVNSLKIPYDMPFESNHPWYDAAFSFAGDIIKESKIKVERLAHAALYCDKADKCTEYAESVSNIVFCVEGAVSSHDWNAVYDTLRSAKLGRLPNGTSDEFKGLKNLISDDIKDIQNFFYASKEDVAAGTNVLAPAVDLLCEIVNEYAARLFDALKEENTFSFDDVEQLAIGMLCQFGENGEMVKSEVADDIIARYDEVLVDEFQDVNDLQNTLFEILSNDSEKLFIVGDVKQSIYAFRGSNPDIFLKKKDSYGDYFELSESKGKKILLSDNFRSRKGICDTVNFFFENLMTRDVGSLVYDTGERLSAGATFPDNGETDTDFLVVDKVDDESDDSVASSEAAAIARYIKDTMAKGNILRGENGELRPARYGDFCILLAALKNKSGDIAEALNACGIPAKVNDGDFFDATETVTALALLHVIDNPQSDVDLLKVLMSPVFGFTASELALVRVAGKDMSLYSALCVYAENDIKAAAFLSLISELRRMSCMLPVDKFVAYVIDKTDMMNIYYSMPGGEVRAENLMMLTKIAGDYSGGSGGSIYGFLRYISAMPKDSVKTAGFSDDGTVKIMTVHRSKGLQFPVCIVAGLATRINKSDSKSAYLYSNRAGIGFRYLKTDVFEKEQNLGHKILAAHTDRRIAQERLRLLYVAMTRAEEKLCLVCCLKNAQSTILRAAQASGFGEYPLSGRFIIKSADSAQYLIAAALMHPDAGKLQSAAECKVTSKTTASRMTVKTVDAAKTAAGESIKAPENVADVGLLQKIRENIDYKYPYEFLSNIPAKTSVSMMANSEEAESFAMTDRPVFMEKDGLTAAGRGTAIHKIMQFIELKGKPDIESEIARLLAENRITENEAAAADRGVIKRFFESELYKRITSADTVKREMRFLTELPVSYYAGEQSNDKFIVQGAVDLCFTEPDGAVVVDFKTDRVKDLSELKEKYSKQLDIYAVACQKIFGKPVKEKIIYSFSLSDTVSV